MNEETVKPGTSADTPQTISIESLAPPKDKNAAALVEVDSGGVFIRSLDELIRFGRLAVASGFAPKGMTEGAAALAIQAGMEATSEACGTCGSHRRPSLLFGLRQGVVINGNFSWRGKGAAALIQNSRVCKTGTLEYWCEGEGENRKGVAKAWRIGYPKESRREFTIKDAKQARLWGKAGPWTEYTNRMLKWKAVGLLADDVFPDVLGGFPLAEEAADFEPIVEEKPPITSRPEMPQPSKPDALLEALDITQVRKEEEPDIVIEELKKITDAPEVIGEAEQQQSGPACKHGNLDSDFCQECSTEADMAIAARDR